MNTCLGHSNLYSYSHRTLVKIGYLGIHLSRPNLFSSHLQHVREPVVDELEQAAKNEHNIHAFNANNFEKYLSDSGLHVKSLRSKM